MAGPAGRGAVWAGTWQRIFPHSSFRCRGQGSPQLSSPHRQPAKGRKSTGVSFPFSGMNATSGTVRLLGPEQSGEQGTLDSTRLLLQGKA